MLVPYRDVIEPNYNDNQLNCGGRDVSTSLYVHMQIVDHSFNSKKLLQNQNLYQKFKKA